MSSTTVSPAMSFTRQRDEWLRAVAGDRRLSAATLRIASHFALDLMSAKNGGTASPSAQAIADAIGANERTVRTSLQRLEAGGFLEITPRGRATSIYRMTSHEASTTTKGA